MRISLLLTFEFIDTICRGISIDKRGFVGYNKKDEKSVTNNVSENVHIGVVVIVREVFSQKSR
ncbi:MAG: hypothetical protein ACI3XL_04945 [Eubacteriales bacterium]